MFLIDYKNNNIYLYNWKINKLKWNFNEIRAYIEKKYQRNINFEIDYINNFKIKNNNNKNKLIKILSTYKQKIYIIENTLIKEIGIEKIFYYLFWFSKEKKHYKILNKIKGFWKDLDFSNLEEKNVKTINDVIKESFLLISNWKRKSKFFTYFLKFSYGLWNYNKENIIDNNVKWIDKNKNIALKKAISELIERVSCSIIDDKFYLKKEIKDKYIYKKEWLKNYNNKKIKYRKIKNLYNNTLMFIPEDFLYYPYSSEIGKNFADSNGVATHYNIKKAILWWLLELIERDCFILMWLLKSWFFYIKNKSLPKELQNNILEIEKDFLVTIHIFILKFDNPIPVSMSIINKKWKIVLGLWSDINFEKSIKKSFMESISMIDYLNNIKIKNKQKDNIFQHIFYYAKNNNLSNLDFLFSIKQTNLWNIKKQFYTFKTYKNIINYYKNLKINFFKYEYKNILNNVFKRKTIRILWDLLPIYFWKKIPNIIINSKRFNYWKNKLKIQKINKKLHPFW